MLRDFVIAAERWKKKDYRRDLNDSFPESGDSPLTGPGWPFVEIVVTLRSPASSVRHALTLLGFHRNGRRDSAGG
jgi:hypothetical protein